MKERILFETYSGSKLYGTDSENSDTDIKGVFLPELNDLILMKAPKHYEESTGSEFHHNSKDDIDKTYYSLQYFLELAAKGETNAIDLLFAYSNNKAVLQTSNEWKYLIKNIDKIITKNINSFVGYYKSQCIKYSIKGSKLEAYTKLKEYLEFLVNKNIKTENGQWISLSSAIKELENYKLGIYTDYIKNGKVIGKRAQFLTKQFGDHAYLVIMNNHELYLMVSDILFNYNDTIITNLHKVKKVIDSYGKRAEIAMENNGADFKAISHCVRVLLEVEELLNNGKISFPCKDAEFIKSIKYKTTSMTREEIMELINKKIEYIDTVLLPNSTLCNNADRKFIDDFILKCYNGYFTK